LSEQQRNAARLRSTSARLARSGALGAGHALVGVQLECQLLVRALCVLLRSAARHTEHGVRVIPCAKHSRHQRLLLVARTTRLRKARVMKR
jgi:hypothetical protein